LKYHPDPPVLHGNIDPAPAVKERFSIKKDNAVIRRLQSGYKSHQGGFAAPRWSEETDPFPLNLKIRLQVKRAKLFFYVHA